MDDLKPCPHRPNCVSSQSHDTRHFIEPLEYGIPQPAARKKLLKILKEMPRTQIVSDKKNYIHAECRSRFFRFADDLEFLFDADHPIIHVRSASRLGYSDFGINRKRVEALRKEFEIELGKLKPSRKRKKN